MSISQYMIFLSMVQRRSLLRYVPGKNGFGWGVWLSFHPRFHKREPGGIGASPPQRLCLMNVFFTWPGLQIWKYRGVSLFLGWLDVLFFVGLLHMNNIWYRFYVPIYNHGSNVSCSEKNPSVAHDSNVARQFAERLTLTSQTFTATMFLDVNRNGGNSLVDAQSIECGCEALLQRELEVLAELTNILSWLLLKFKLEVELSHENGSTGQQLSYQCLEIETARNSTKGLLQGDMCRLVVWTTLVHN